jgi:hypothetical protein
MRLNELRDTLKKQPFEPFRLRMSNGDEYIVRHPEFALLTKSTVFVGLPSKREGVPDRVVQLDILHVVSIEPVNGARRSGSRRPRGE